MDAAIQINTLSKTFGNGRKALQEIDLRIDGGEMVALIGASVSGNSTLLRHMAGLMAGAAFGRRVRVSAVQPGQAPAAGQP